MADDARVSETTPHPLLVLQDLDLELVRLRTARERLPERASLAEARTTEAGLAQERERHTADRRALSTEQRRFEDDAASLADRAETHRTRMYSGEVTAAKDLADLEREIAHLDERRNGLEEQALELMERGEPLDARLAELATAIAGAETARIGAETALVAAEAELDVQIDDVSTQREATRAGLDCEELAAYDRLAVGEDRVVAELASTCGVCGIGLSAREHDRLGQGPIDVPQPCECGRGLLIRRT